MAAHRTPARHSGCLALHLPVLRSDFPNCFLGTVPPQRLQFPQANTWGRPLGGQPQTQAWPNPGGKVDGQCLSLGKQRHCQGLYLLAGHPEHSGQGVVGGVWRGTLNFHCPVAFPHPSPQPRTVSGRPDPLLCVRSPPAALEGRAPGVLTFSLAPASWGLSNILETSLSRPHACGHSYTLRLWFWSVLGSGSVSTSCVSLGKSLQCSKLRFLHW